MWIDALADTTILFSLIGLPFLAFSIVSLIPALAILIASAVCKMCHTTLWKALSSKPRALLLKYLDWLEEFFGAAY